MENEKLDELLNQIFSNINSWLNFAEAKNAANIALVIACLTAIFSLNRMNVLLYFISILFLISGISSLCSLFPNLESRLAKKFSIIKKKRQKTDLEDNLLFFEKIKNYSGIEYVKLVTKLYLQDNKEEFSKYQLDLADEIVYNAEIADFKYRCFRIAVKIDIGAFVFLILGIIVA